MQTIHLIFNNFKKNVECFESLKLSNLENLDNAINLSRHTLGQLREIVIANNCFCSKKDEIYFFKCIKPFISGRLKFFASLRLFQFEWPNADIREQKKYVRQAIKDLESYKKRNLHFWKYAKNKQNTFDKLYFLRRNNKLDFVYDVSQYFYDPEFSTSHDSLMAKVIAYELLTNYYKQLLIKLKLTNNEALFTSENLVNENQLNWTGSKTDLIELIYALHSSKVISNGNEDLIKTVKTFENLFNIKLGNPYKTYSEIKARRSDQTKFLDNLKANLLTKIMLEDE